MSELKTKEEWIKESKEQSNKKLNILFENIGHFTLIGFNFMLIMLFSVVSYELNNDSAGYFSTLAAIFSAFQMVHFINEYKKYLKGKENGKTSSAKR